MMPFLETMPSLSGCLILAGGQGTRLGFKGPKGCVQLPLKEKKTLFQILFEKVKDPKALIAVMTSPLNHEATVAYLEKEAFFGLENVCFFKQEMEGESPNGNGKAFTYFCKAGIWEKWRKKGAKYLQVLPIDNPLAIPFDEMLLKANQEVELVLRGVKRKGADEKIGVILKGKTLKVEEYTEATYLNRNFLGNTGIFSCSLDFVKRAASISLPLHTVRKKIEDRWISKKEYFIFDLFPYAKTFKLLLSDRKKYFAPIKNASGLDSLETALKALMT